MSTREFACCVNAVHFNADNARRRFFFFPVVSSQEISSLMLSACHREGWITAIFFVVRLRVSFADQSVKPAGERARRETRICPANFPGLRSPASYSKMTMENPAFPRVRAGAMEFHSSEDPRSLALSYARALAYQRIHLSIIIEVTRAHKYIHGLARKSIAMRHKRIDRVP